MKKSKYISLITIILLALISVYLFVLLGQSYEQLNTNIIELSETNAVVAILQTKLNELLDEIHLLEINHSQMRASEVMINNHLDRISQHTPSNWFVPDFMPLTENFAISQTFTDFHTAIDFSSSQGTDVYAAGSGIVIASYDDRYLGNIVLIDHLNSYKSLYAHLNKYTVFLNNFVEKGQKIGEVGNTGNSTNPHLHFQVFFQNNPIDPNTLMNITTFKN